MKHAFEFFVRRGVNPVAVFDTDAACVFERYQTCIGAQLLAADLDGKVVRAPDDVQGKFVTGHEILSIRKGIPIWTYRIVSLKFRAKWNNVTFDGPKDSVFKRRRYVNKPSERQCIDFIPMRAEGLFSSARSFNPLLHRMLYRP